MSIEFTGERVIPGRVDPDLWNEHISRYEFAKRFVMDGRVLDAGCGTGYGCATLAQTARFAIGFDIAAEAVCFAAANYGREHVNWLQSSLTTLPFSDGVFELVVAFEVIEHIVDWKEFLFEARRVLTDTGVFLVSTPNKTFYSESRQQSGPNPFHQHEFEHDEFNHALSQVFPHVKLVLQNHSECVLFETKGTMVGQAHVEQSSAPQEANFFVAVCSNQPVSAPAFVYVPRAANVLKERAEHIRRLEGELSTKNQWLASLQGEHADLVALHETQTRDLEASNMWARQLDARVNEAGTRVVALQEELDEQQRANASVVEEARRELEARTHWARDLEAELLQCRAELGRCVALLDQAEATVVERTNWALSIQRQSEALEAIMAGARSSRWVRLGRLFHVGPELPS